MTITLPKAGAEVLQQSSEPLGPVFRKFLEQWVAEHNDNTSKIAQLLLDVGVTFADVKAALAAADSAVGFNGKNLENIGSASFVGNLISTAAGAIDAFSVWRANGSQDITIRDSADGGAVTFSWQGRGRIASPFDGVFELWNNAKTAYSRLRVSGILGTVTNDDATSGDVGEHVTAQATGVGSWSSSVAKNIVSMALGAGDWDVQCVGRWAGGAGVVGNGIVVSVSSVSNTLGGPETRWDSPTMPTASWGVNAVTPWTRLKFPPGGGTAYGVGLINFSAGTPSADGYLRARRPR